MALQLHLFGSPQCRREGRPIIIRRRKAIALLAYLAVTAQTHSRDTLATLFWPEYDQSGSRANLRRDLSYLKRALGDDVLAIDWVEVGLNPQVTLHLDVTDFITRLAQAKQHDDPLPQLCPDCLITLTETVDLYTGDFMVGFSLPDCPEFDEWQFFQRESLRQTLAAALQRLIGWHVVQGTYEQAIEYGRRWLALDPLHEPAHRQLMQLYAWDGQQAAALRQFDECVRLLDEELGVAPEAETAVLYQAIKARQLPPPATIDASPLPTATMTDPRACYVQGEFLATGSHGQVYHGRDEVSGADERRSHATSQASPSSINGQPKSVHNLPTRSTPFIGREQELADIISLLVSPHSRLLTLVGPGGIGKTRLALAAGTAVTESFVDGVYFVPLAPLKSAEHIPSALADSLDFHFFGAEDPRQQLRHYLRRKQALLVVDNFEHVLDGASLLIEIVEAAPEVKILVTSRERLNLSGEAVYPLAGMNYPDWQRATETEPTAYSAVKLLWQRARLVRADFAPHGEDLVHAVRICQLVDGMPLALVLAAGWLDLLSLKEIAAEITRSLDFLETEMLDVPVRQRSIRAVFDSSLQRLTTEEQRVFMKLAVFRNGFTRQAAGVVAGATLRVLRTLANKSLISANQDGRYNLHELLRQYGETQLKASAGEEAVYAAHSAYYLDLLHRLEDDLKGRRQLAALNEIDSEFENMRAAWEWALEHGDEAAVAGALESLHLFCDMRSRHQEGAALFLLARDRLAPSPGEAPGLTWGRILTRGAFLRLMLAATNSADIAPDLDQGLAIARQHESRPEIAFALRALGSAATLGNGDLAGAQALLEQSQNYYQELGDRFYLSYVLHSHGLAHATLSGLDAYYALTRQALELMVELGIRVSMAFSLSNLAEAALGLGDYPAAENYINEAIAIAGEMGTRGILAYDKVMLSLLCFLRGDWEQAEALNAEGLKIASDVNFSVTVAYALAQASLLSGMAGDYTAGQQQAKESLALPANNGLGIILAQWGLSIAECGLERDDAAWQALQTALQQTRNFGSRAILTWLLPIATILRSRQGDSEGAVELLALGAAHPLNAAGWQVQWHLLAEVRAHLERDLGIETFQAAWERGEQLDIDVAIIQLTSEK
jgi:predicted ATPase/DNA-binding SARP family transcriptional activator